MEFLVEISGTTVTITCPIEEEEEIQWEMSGKRKDTTERKLILKDHDSNPANVSCSRGNQKHQLYLNARGERSPSGLGAQPRSPVLPVGCLPHVITVHADSFLF